VLVPLVAAVVGYGLFVAVESRVAAPLMRPETMVRQPVVSGTFLMLLATGFLLAAFGSGVAVASISDIGVVDA
jgi:hypothetical protein